MSKYLSLSCLLFLSFLVSCEDDGVYTPPYIINEPSDGTIESGVSGTMPYFMSEDQSEHRLIMGMKPQAGIYTMNEIGRIELTFNEADWEDRLRDMVVGDDELLASAVLNGFPLGERVGVRIKGTPINETAKTSYFISLDAEDDDQQYNGYYTLALNSIEYDPSALREVVYRHCIRRYIPAVQVNFVSLFVNGVDQGLYINTEHLNASFINKWFVSTNGSRWRAEPGNAADPSKVGSYGTGYSGLNYLGETAADYEPYYDLKNKSSQTNPLEDLIAVCRILEQISPDSLEAAIRKELDLDRALWYLACENIFMDEDGYVNKGGTDYYLFWNKETEILTPLEYDGKDTFHEENVQWSPFYHEDEPRFPLLNKLLAAPSIRQRYLAHYRTILNEVFSQEFLNPLIDNLGAVIDSAIAADPRKSFSYQDHKNAVADMKETVSKRVAYLYNLDELNVAGLTISSVSQSVDGTPWKQPTATDTVTVTATVGGGFANSVYLCAGTGMFGGFRRLQMFDNGENGDAVAGDGIFTALINPQQSGVRVRFYIEAVKADASRTRTYMPAGAEHDVYTYVVR